MNKRLAGVLAFALVVAGGASYLLYVFLGARLESQEQQTASRQVVVATRDLTIGTMIAEADVRLEDWSGAIPKSALTSTEEAVGRGVLTNVYEGEPILEERLALEGAGAGLAATIPEGKRAVAIRVNDVVAVAGFVTPGMRVDILIMGNPPDQPSSLGTISKTLLQNVEVLSAGQQIQRDNQGEPVRVPVINVLVTPEEAEILSLASNRTSIQLVLRNPLDDKVVTTRGSAVSLLFQEDKLLPLPRQPAPRSTRSSAPAPPQPIRLEPEPVVVEILSGARKSQVQFDEEN